MVDDAKAPAFDEAKLGNALALGLPLTAVVGAAAAGLLINASVAILVLIGGALLGVIALLWASIRVLSGDAALPPELEALEGVTRGVDALASRKKMLIRAIKDLENERDLGKLENDDFDLLSTNYREQLKTVMKSMDETLAPHRDRAEQIAREHLEKAGVAEKPDQAPKEGPAKVEEKKTERQTCPKCDASNEPDAKFCKECATSLVAKQENTDEEEERDADE